MSSPPRTARIAVDATTVEEAVGVFRMLADPTRLTLLHRMRDTEVGVSELAETLDKPQALVSQHLAKLRMARLVTTRRHGNQVFYRLANDHVRQLVVDGLFHAEHLMPGLPHHHQDAP